MKQHRTFRTCPHCGASLDPGERCDCGSAVLFDPLDYKDFSVPGSYVIDPHSPEGRAFAQLLGLPAGHALSVSWPAVHK